jgi:hypothetical protein
MKARKNKMAWKPQVKVVGDPKWYENGLSFETEEEAISSARSLYYRWSMAENYRVVEVETSANYLWDDKVGVVSR